jgi:hypothetical protein
MARQDRILILDSGLPHWAEAPATAAEVRFTANGRVTSIARLFIDKDGTLSARLDDDQGYPIFEVTPVADYDAAERLFTEWAGVVIRDALEFGGDDLS